ncbi:hypothetical protein PAMP_004909 [Pampus punctatissimus]
MEAVKTYRSCSPRLSRPDQSDPSLPPPPPLPPPHCSHLQNLQTALLQRQFAPLRIRKSGLVPKQTLSRS